MCFSKQRRICFWKKLMIRAHSLAKVQALTDSLLENLHWRKLVPNILRYTTSLACLLCRWQQFLSNHDVSIRTVYCSTEDADIGDTMIFFYWGQCFLKLFPEPHLFGSFWLFSEAKVEFLGSQILVKNAKKTRFF